MLIETITNAECIKQCNEFIANSNQYIWLVFFNMALTGCMIILYLNRNKYSSEIYLKVKKYCLKTILALFLMNLFYLIWFLWLKK